MDDETQLKKQIIKELGLDNLSQDKQQEMIIKATEVLLKRIFLETMEKLGDQGRVDYEEMIKKEANPQQMEEFLKSNINDYDKVVQRVVDEFKEEMKRDVNK